MKKMMVLMGFMVMLALVAASLISVPVMAQDTAQPTPTPLPCEAFLGGSTDTRVGYYMGEGAGYVDAGLYRNAVDSYTCVLQIDAGNIEALIKRALVYSELRWYDEALEDYTDAIGLDSSDEELYNNRGLVYAQMGEYEEALADFNAAINLNGRYLISVNNRGLIHAIMEEYDQALGDFNRAIDLNPDYPQSYALIGMIRSTQALDSYREYLQKAQGRGDQRVQAAAGSLESRSTFDLRFDDGSWFLYSDFDDEVEMPSERLPEATPESTPDATGG